MSPGIVAGVLHPPSGHRKRLGRFPTIPSTRGTPPLGGADSNRVPAGSVPSYLPGSLCFPSGFAHSFWIIDRLYSAASNRAAGQSLPVFVANQPVWVAGRWPAIDPMQSWVRPGTSMCASGPGHLRPAVVPGSLQAGWLTRDCRPRDPSCDCWADWPTFDSRLHPNALLHSPLSTVGLPRVSQARICCLGGQLQLPPDLLDVSMSCSRLSLTSHSLFGLLLWIVGVRLDDAGRHHPAYRSRASTGEI